MARLAIGRTMFASQFEARRVVVKVRQSGIHDRALPRERRMTTRAGDAETPSMNDRLRVTRHTRLRRSLEDIRLMARLAIGRTMFAGQLEPGRVVVERRRSDIDDRALPCGR